VAPLLISVRGAGDPGHRIAEVAAAVRAGKGSATGPPPIAVLGPMFRIAAALGGYRWYMRHQHRIHTLVSHVRGPDGPVTFAGSTVKAILPVAVGEAGNTTISFTVLSYADTVAITAVTDSDRVPDLSTLTDALQAELDSITTRLDVSA
jgi:diacylglycerol O-acyltransferase / wax synthase